MKGGTSEAPSSLLISPSSQLQRVPLPTSYPLILSARRSEKLPPGEDRVDKLPLAVAPSAGLSRSNIAALWTLGERKEK